MVSLLLTMLGSADRPATFQSSQVELGLKVLHMLADRDHQGNACVSPFSIQIAATLLRTGAKGATDAELAAVLQHGTTTANAMADQIANNRAFTETLRKQGNLFIANGIWSVDPLVDKFAKDASTKFGATTRRTQFPEPGLSQVNAWVKENTNGRIPQVLKELDASTEVVLANAVWFKDSWSKAFDTSHTVDLPFSIPGSDGSVRVPTLVSPKMRYAVGVLPGLTIYELEMKNSKLVAALPDESSNAETLNASWSFVLGGQYGSEQREGLVTLPKVEFSTDVDLKDVLHRLGMKISSTSAADFSGMSKQKTFLSQAIHKTYLKWDEVGTEAAAATVISNSRGGPPPGMRLNRPFLFAIKAGPHILFAGFVNDPRRR